jgi:RNA polymerase sigma-70 factor (ECF subfamily)
MAFQRSSRLGSILSGIFESGKPASDVESLPRNDVVQIEDVEAPARPPQIGDSAAAEPTVAPEEESGPTPDVEEAALVERAKEDPAAFGALYERYVDRIYAYIYHRVGNMQDAEDLTARAFYRALSKLHTYEDRGYPFSAWLFRIAHNLVANWHRDHSRRSFLSLDRIWHHSPDNESPEHLVEQTERYKALWSAISRLPEDRRNLLIYKFGSRLSNVEIGELMNKSESAIKSLYFRTLATLRKELESKDL